MKLGIAYIPEGSGPCANFRFSTQMCTLHTRP